MVHCSGEVRGLMGSGGTDGGTLSSWRDSTRCCCSQI